MTVGATVVLLGCAGSDEATTDASASASAPESATAESAPPSPGATFDAAAWRSELDAWIADRYASLRKPDGWLSLAGLYWLEPGENTFGADPANQLVFPADKAPPR